MVAGCRHLCSPARGLCSRSAVGVVSARLPRTVQSSLVLAGRSACQWERTVSVTGRNENGKKVTRKVSVRQARAALVAAGGNPRGRIKTADLASTIGLTVDPAPVSEAAKLRAKLAAAGVTVGRRGRLSADQLEAAKSL